jgi:hypothetical protein
MNKLWRPWTSVWPVALLGLVLLSACGTDAGADLPTTTPSPDVGTPTLGFEKGPCNGGRLTVGDLGDIDEQLADGVTEAREAADDWQRDARLVALRVGCELLEPSFNIRATFYSERIETYFFSDTRETQVAPRDDLAGQELPLDQVSFAGLANSLLRAGYAPSVTLDPGSNVEVRVNTQGAPFGPPEVPDNAVVFHVALESRGEIVDLFATAADGTIYQYSR